jgi:hypothetical protein
MNIIDFDPKHLAAIKPQLAQAHEFNPESLASPTGLAWSAMDGDKPIACAGLVEVWGGRAYAWAILSQDAGPYMRWLTREIRFRLARAPFQRVEMAVDASFANGCRWAEMLGFSMEGLGRKYLPNGHDAFIYARV